MILPYATNCQIEIGSLFYVRTALQILDTPCGQIAAEQIAIGTSVINHFNKIFFHADSRHHKNMTKGQNQHFVNTSTLIECIQVPNIYVSQ